MPLFGSLLLPQGTLTTTGSTLVAASFNSASSNAAQSLNNGVSWSSKLIPTDFWFDCAWCSLGTGFFCMVSGSAGGTATSPDGGTWTGHTSAGSLPGGSWAVGFNGSYLLAVSVNGFHSYKSTDGITWTGPYLIPQSAHWSKPAWNGSSWVTVDNGNATGFAATSPDGQTWTQQAMPSASVTYTDPVWNGTVYACLSLGSNVAATSPDGQTWTARTAGNALGASQTGLCWNGTVYCGLSQDGSKSQTSSDGINWTSHNTTISVPSGGYLSLEWNGSVFSTMDVGSTLGYTSPDGITWTSHATPGALGTIGTNFLVHGSY